MLTQSTNLVFMIRPPNGENLRNTLCSEVYAEPCQRPIWTFSENS